MDLSDHEEAQREWQAELLHAIERGRAVMMDRGMAIRFPAQRTVSTTTADLGAWLTRWEEEVVAEYNSDLDAYESLVHGVFTEDISADEMRPLALAAAYLGLLREGGISGDREHFPDYSHGMCPYPYCLSLVLQPRVPIRTPSVALDDSRRSPVASLGWQCAPDSSPLVVPRVFQWSPDPRSECASKPARIPMVAYIGDLASVPVVARPK